jgi:hypothetical protein
MYGQIPSPVDEGWDLFLSTTITASVSGAMVHQWANLDDDSESIDQNRRAGSKTPSLYTPQKSE